jgi:hypothetical protein
VNYLLHFDEPYPRDRRGSVQHYIGFAQSKRTFKLRIEHHRNGSGARLMAAVSAAGIGFVVARTWDSGNRTDERKLKNRKNARKLCPVCRRKAA